MRWLPAWLYRGKTPLPSPNETSEVVTSTTPQRTQLNWSMPSWQATSGDARVMTAFLIATSTVIAFGLGLGLGLRSYPSLHRWRLGRAQRRARQRADPVKLLPSQTTNSPIVARCAFGQALAQQSTCAASTSRSQVSAWGRRLLRRAYKGAAQAHMAEWSVLPVQPCPPLAALVKAREAGMEHVVEAPTPPQTDMPAAELLSLPKQTFHLVYAPRARLAVWCGFYMSRESLLSARQQPRLVSFFTDHTIPKSIRASLAETKCANYDRGHLAPHASVASTPQSGVEAALLTNVVLQHKGVNRGVWKQLELLTREYVMRTPPTTCTADTTGCAQEAAAATAASPLVATAPPRRGARRKKAKLSTSTRRRTRASVGRPRRTKTKTKKTSGRASHTTPGTRQKRTTTTSASPRHCRRRGDATTANPITRPRGRPRGTSSQTIKAVMAERATRRPLLWQLMEAHTAYSLSSARSHARNRWRARLSRAPLVGRACLSVWDRCEMWWHRALRSSRRQRKDARRTRLAVCTGPLFFPSEATPPKRRGRASLTNPVSSAGDRYSANTSASLIADAMFMAIWDTRNHNHIAFVIPNSEAGDVHPRRVRRGRRPARSTTATQPAMRDGWGPVLEPFVVAWVDLERMLTESTELVLGKHRGVIAPMQLFPQLQRTRHLRTASLRWRAALLEWRRRTYNSVSQLAYRCSAPLRAMQKRGEEVNDRSPIGAPESIACPNSSSISGV